MTLSTTDKSLISQLLQTSGLKMSEQEADAAIEAVAAFAVLSPEGRLNVLASQAVAFAGTNDGTVAVPEPGTEDRLFWLDAAEQHGFITHDEGTNTYVAGEEAVVQLMRAARQQGRTDVLSFQSRTQDWLDKVTEGDATDLAERLARFLEESLELVQALGMTLDDADKVVEYVFDRPAGEPPQEVGGVTNTLAALCTYTGHDMMACAEAELARVQNPEVIAKVRRKRAGRHGRGPLPGEA